MNRLIELVPPNPDWATQFKLEALKLRKILSGNCEAVHHIGSTGILTIYAKPVIDILVVVNDLASVDALNPLFETLGYECMGEFGIAGRRFYWKEEAKRTYHVHIMAMGNEFKRRVAFRDLLRQKDDLCKQYDALKQSLAKQYPDDREAYTEAKADFIQVVLGERD